MENTSGALMADVIIELSSRLINQNTKVNQLEYELDHKTRELNAANKKHIHLEEIIIQRSEQLSDRDKLIAERDKMLEDHKSTVERLENELSIAEKNFKSCKVDHAVLYKQHVDRMKEYRRMERQIKKLTRKK